MRKAGEAIYRRDVSCFPDLPEQIERFLTNRDNLAAPEAVAVP